MEGAKEFRPQVEIGGGLGAEPKGNAAVSRMQEAETLILPDTFRLGGSVSLRNDAQLAFSALIATFALCSKRETEDRQAF